MKAIKKAVKSIKNNSFTDRDLATKESMKRNLNGEPTCISVYFPGGIKTYILAPRTNRR